MIEDIQPFQSEFPDPMPGNFPMRYGDGEDVAHHGTGVDLRERDPNYMEDAHAFDVWKIDNSATPKTAYVKPGWVLYYDKDNHTMYYVEPTVGAGTMTNTPVIVSAAHTIYCKVTTDKFDVVVSPFPEIISSSSPSYGVTILADADTDTPGEYWYKIADFEADSDGFVSVKNQYHHGSPIIHRAAGPQGETGEKGETGDVSFYASVFLRSSSAPATPTTGGSYNFATQTLTPPSAPVQWFATPPASDGYPLYVSMGVFSAATGGTDNTTTWSTPALLVQDGAKGETGAKGDKGDKGDKGETGASGVEDDTVTLVEGTYDITAGQERPQVNVSERAVTAPEEALGYSKAFTVEGNGMDGSLWFSVFGSSAIKILTWRDGLIATVGEGYDEYPAEGDWELRVTDAAVFGHYPYNPT